MDLTNLNDDQLIKFALDHIRDLESSNLYERMKLGRDYYEGRQAIDSKKRLAVGDGGRLVEITNLPNNRLKDNQYQKLVDQKVNYIASERPIVGGKDEKYANELSDYLDKRFTRTLNYLLIDVYNCGIGWMYLYSDEKKMKYKIMDPLNIFPVWQDADKENLDAIIRKRSVKEYKDKIIHRHFIEIYTDTFIKCFEENADGKYVKVEDRGYLERGEEQFTYGKIPFVYFKLNGHNSTLLDRVKSLQDAINTLLSNFADVMLEDARNTILILKGYEGENLGEFRRQLAQYGAVKLAGDGSGDLSSLQIEVNASNYEQILQILKDKLIENGRGIDTKFDRGASGVNELNIKSMYADIELDAVRLELELSASFEYLQSFYKLINKINTPEIVDISFKRSAMVNESSIVDMIQKSKDILPLSVILQNHPLVQDAAQAMADLEGEKEKMRNEFMAMRSGLDDDPFRTDDVDKENE